MDKCKAHACSITNEVATMVAGKFTYTKVKHNTRHCSFSLSCELYKTQSLTIVSLHTILRTTSIVAILQVPDGEDSG